MIGPLGDLSSWQFLLEISPCYDSDLTVPLGWEVMSKVVGDEVKITVVFLFAGSAPL